MMRVQGDVARALQFYERALEADPRDRDARMARKDLAAERALSNARYDEVSHSREQIVDKDQAARIERQKRLHLSTEELHDELAKLEERLAEAPSDVDLMIEMAELLVDLAAKASELRVKALKKAIARADKDGDTVGADRLEEELRVLEIEELRRRIDLAPADPALRLEMGKALIRSGAYDDAASELQKAVHDPRLASEAHANLARCFQEKGYLDLAKSEYSRALKGLHESDEPAREILYNLGAIAEAEGNAVEARSYYSRIFEADIGYRDVAKKMEQLRGA